MQIKQIDDHKKQYLSLLLLADEQEDMIDKYLDRGTMFALFDNNLKAICIVTDEGKGIFKIKNIAAQAQYQERDYRKQLLTYLFAYHKGQCNAMLVPTGDRPLTISFYLKYGFIPPPIQSFFTDYYDHSIFEDGKQLIDMLYLKKIL